MRGRAVAVREDRVLAVLAGPGEALVAAVKAARPLQPPVPAAGRLEEVPADRAHVAELRARRKPARLAQRGRDLRVALQLRECRARPDSPALDAARHDAANVDERVRLHDP